MRLNVGCGNLLLPGYLNIDLQNPAAIAPGQHFLQADVRAGLPCQDGAACEVRADQFLEHLTLEELPPFLRDCRRVLCPGGEARFTFPDLAGQIAAAEAGLLDHVVAANGRQPIDGVPAGLLVLNWTCGLMWGHRSVLTTRLVLEMVNSAGLRGTWASRCDTNGLVVAVRDK